MGITKTIAAFVAAAAEAGGAPSIEEIARHLDVSKTTARDRIAEAIEAGFIEKIEGRQRGLRLTDQGKRVA